MEEEQVLSEKTEIDLKMDLKMKSYKNDLKKEIFKRNQLVLFPLIFSLYSFLSLHKITIKNRKNWLGIDYHGEDLFMYC